MCENIFAAFSERFFRVCIFVQNVTDERFVLPCFEILECKYSTVPLKFAISL